jgi:hypothetical protein
MAKRGDLEAADALGVASNLFSGGTVGNEFVLKPSDTLFGKGFNLGPRVLKSGPLHSSLKLRPLVVACGATK